ncbi:uncharacterized protein FTOL_08312 [Fusarium torulosum]|uniref:Phosphatidylglycerol lysyltransferase C-terminal domain-containing protein n=1 Tax=Fusarium torulosum TaxID=33205 RepID=A0AAE8MF26_9HYPO|nr:uncharacterized protein FTOL_08312 [Fusarium torulosum]
MNKQDIEAGSTMSSTLPSSTLGNKSGTESPRISTSPSSTTTKHDDDIITRIYYAAHNVVQVNSTLYPKSKDPSENTRSEPQNAAFDSAYHLYARTSHMGVLDPSYKIFTSKAGHGSLLYKLQARTIIIAGDPLCSEYHRQPLLEELYQYRKSCGLGLAFVGVSQEFAEYARQHGWATLHFGYERVLNPLTNKVLQKQASKRILSQNKQLLDPKRGAVSVHLYCPSVQGVNSALETQLQKLYDEWRNERNRNKTGCFQAFVTVYNLFSHPDSTVFLYTSDSKGQPNGFATLRALGAQTGFHIDPCIATQSASRGITDLLIVTAMELLKNAEIGYLSLGFEPLDALEEIHGKSDLQSWLWKRGYSRMIKSVPTSGKVTYFNKFYPDETLASKLFICLPGRGLPVLESIALMHFANMDIRKLLPKRNSEKGLTRVSTGA